MVNTKQQFFGHFIRPQGRSAPPYAAFPSFWPLMRAANDNRPPLVVRMRNGVTLLLLAALAAACYWTACPPPWAQETDSRGRS